MKIEKHRRKLNGRTRTSSESKSLFKTKGKDMECRKEKYKKHHLPIIGIQKEGIKIMTGIKLSKKKFLEMKDVNFQIDRVHGALSAVGKSKPLLWQRGM